MRGGWQRAHGGGANPTGLPACCWRSTGAQAGASCALLQLWLAAPGRRGVGSRGWARAGLAGERSGQLEAQRALLEVQCAVV